MFGEAQGFLFNNWKKSSKVLGSRCKSAGQYHVIGGIFFDYLNLRPLSDYVPYVPRLSDELSHILVAIAVSISDPAEARRMRRSSSKMPSGEQRS